MKLTGILSTSVTNLDDKDLPFGITVAPGVVASNHQHLFCVRLDPAVDDDNGGKGLVVAEVNAEMLPFGPDNPAGGCCVCDVNDSCTSDSTRDTSYLKLYCLLGACQLPCYLFPLPVGV